jgi:hypothetical protein
MKKLAITGLVLTLLFCFSQFAEAQVSRYQGTYDVVANYTAHYSNSFPVRYTTGYGVLTLGSNGSASYTVSFPFDGYAFINGFSYSLDPYTGSGTGAVDSTGVFRFDNGVVGSCILCGTLRSGSRATAQVGVGSFNDGVGRGIFVIVKR